MKKQKEYNLKSLTSYKSAFSLLQTVLVVVVLMLSFLVIFVYYSSQKTISNLQNSIYIMDKTTGAVSLGNRVGQTPATRIFEYRDQVNQFFHLWYQLDPASFDDNIDRGLKLIGKSGKVLYTQYLNADVKKNLITNGIVTKAIVDSIDFNTSTMPIQGVVYGRQKIIRKNSTIIRRIVCSFSVTDINRSQDNSHGALLDDWKIINNEILNNE